MVKIKAALIFAVIAALVVALAGLLKDVRFIVIALRCAIGFLVAGVVAYIVILLLEAKSIMLFDFETMEEAPAGGGVAAPAEESGEGREAAHGETAGEARMEQGEEAEGTFQPLDASSLKHMQTPES